MSLAGAGGKGQGGMGYGLMGSPADRQTRLKTLPSQSFIACKTKTLGSLYSHALLILTKSSKFKNQAVNEHNFKDLRSSKCPISLERIVCDLESDVHYR